MVLGHLLAILEVKEYFGHLRYFQGYLGRFRVFLGGGGYFDHF